jgi:hypothetical protein
MLLLPSEASVEQLRSQLDSPKGSAAEVAATISDGECEEDDANDDNEIIIATGFHHQTLVQTTHMTENFWIIFMKMAMMFCHSCFLVVK